MSIERKDGKSVLDGWTYALDDQGNITRTDQADGSCWTYGYDGRYRLTTADRCEASGSSIRAQYAYGYDLADNLTAKTEPFLDDFEDGNYTGWSSGGGWSATTKVLKENYSTATRITRNNSQNDVDIRFRYMTTDTTAGLFGEMCFRTSSTNALTNNTVLRMSTDGLKLQKVVAGVVTVLDSETTATATANTWYRVRILAKGNNVTVWRGEGDDGPMEEVLSSSAVPTLTTVSMWFISGANAAFAYDDVEIVANGWTSDTTFATNSGNELTSSTFGGVTTTYGYDAWGNMTSKARGSYTAAYAWHYGGKLASVTSDFPSEGAVTYAYGGDGKRRERDDGTTVTWYNWDTGEGLLNEEDGSGNLVRTYIAKLAFVEGFTPATGHYKYHSRDVTHTSGRLRDQSRASLSFREYDTNGLQVSRLGGGGSSEGYRAHTWDALVRMYFSRPYSPELARSIGRSSNGSAKSDSGSGPEPNAFEFKYRHDVYDTVEFSSKVDSMNQIHIGLSQTGATNCEEYRFIQIASSIFPILNVFILTCPAAWWHIDSDKGSSDYPFYEYQDKPNGEMTDWPGAAVWFGVWQYFETCAVCVKGRDKGLVMGCFTWQATTDSSGKTVYTPSKKTRKNGSSPSVAWLRTVDKKNYVRPWNSDDVGR